MDKIQASFIIAIIFIIGVVIAVLRRRSTKAKIETPFGSLKMDASDGPAPGILAEDVKSKTGSVRADDATGKGIVARRITADKDVELSASKASEDPKE